jgi:cation/acetate symporter
VSRVIVSKMLVMAVALLAALMAALKFTDILLFVAAAFSLAASAFFPALVMGIFWQRANRAGAVAGMLTGLGVCCWYMAHNLPVLRGWLGVAEPLAQTQWWGVDAVAAGVFAVPAGLLALVAVSLATAPPSRDQHALVERLRVPAPDEWPEPPAGQAPGAGVEPADSSATGAPAGRSGTSTGR